MTSRLPHADTLDVAKETLAMSEKSGDRTLKFFGLAMLFVTGLATAFHAGHTLYRDLFPAKGKGNPGHGGQSPETGQANSGAASEAMPSRHQDGDAERSWVHKARLTGRTADEHARPAYRDRPGPAQQR